MNLNQKNVMLNNRLVAFLDVLGFSNRLDTDPLPELYLKFKSLVDETRHKIFFNDQPDGRSNFSVSQYMSDSLVLVSNDVQDV